MEITPQEYQAYVKKKAAKSPIVRDTAQAFAIGGAICVIGQAIQSAWMSGGLGREDAGTATACTLVFLSALLTGLNVYQKLARFGGAGTLVPITGFANAVAAPAIEFKTEGLVTGLGAKMFIIAGPVLVYGITAATIYGLIRYIAGLF